MSGTRHRLAATGPGARRGVPGTPSDQEVDMEKRARGEIRVHERVDGRRTYSLRFRVDGKRHSPHARNRCRWLERAAGRTQTRGRARGGPRGGVAAAGASR